MHIIRHKTQYPLQDLLSLTSVAIADGGEASLKKGCCRSSNADERLNGSFCKHASMKDFSFGDTFKKTKNIDNRYCA